MSLEYLSLDLGCPRFFSLLCHLVDFGGTAPSAVRPGESPNAPSLPGNDHRQIGDSPHQNDTHKIILLFQFCQCSLL